MGGLQVAGWRTIAAVVGSLCPIRCAKRVGCSRFAARGSLRAMPRAAHAVRARARCVRIHLPAQWALLALSACSGGDYEIGRFADGGVGDCAGRTGALVCSGFEQRALADWTATELVAQGELERTTERAHRGSGALRASSSAMMSVAVVSASFPPLSEGSVYLRAHLFVPAELPTETINVFFVGAEPAPDPFKGLDFNLEGGAIQIYSPQSAVQRHTGALVIPRDRWFCFRARIDLDAADGRVEAWVDDQQALLAEGLHTLPEEGVHLFRAGLDWSSGQDAFFELFFDDVVVDTAEAQCL
jgi:hypothetical protein